MLKIRFVSISLVICFILTFCAFFKASAVDPGLPTVYYFQSVEEFMKFHDETIACDEEALNYDLLRYVDLSENILIPFLKEGNTDLKLTGIRYYLYDADWIDPFLGVTYRDSDFYYMLEVSKKSENSFNDYKKFLGYLTDDDTVLVEEIDGCAFWFKSPQEISMGYLFLNNHVICVRVSNSSGTDRKISFDDFGLYTVEELRETFISSDNGENTPTDPPVDEKSPVWKTPVFIVTSCAAVVAVAALGTLVIVKKKRSK